MNKGILILSIIIYLFLSGCKPETIKPEDKTGHLVLKFNHLINGEPFEADTLKYINESGNHYLINDVMYFISDVSLYGSDGSMVHIEKQQAIHYIDNHIAETGNWTVFDPVPEGTYDSISFIFGLNEQRNISFFFVNPPEVNMFWPTVLGGGYHYMMINGKWKNLQNELIPFDFHLGIGQIYSGNTINTDSIIGFVHNYFEVKLPLNGCTFTNSDTTTIELKMNIESWFKTPHSWDFNYWGGAIMQNQDAMNTVKENGFDVFEIDKIY